MEEEGEGDVISDPVDGQTFSDCHRKLLGSTDRVYPPVPIKDVGEDVHPASEAMKSVVVPVGETAVPAEPEPEVESKHDSVHTEFPIVESVEVDAVPDVKQVEPVVSHEIDSFPSPLTSIRSLKVDLTEDETVAEPVESKPAELEDDVPPIIEESGPTPAEPVIVDLSAAKEVEPHAAELEVAPEPIETVTVVPDIPPVHVHSLMSSCRSKQSLNTYPKNRPMSKNLRPRSNPR